MAKTTVKSGLAGKLGAAGSKAVTSHKDDETNFGGGGSLPEGIEHGIAQLVECKFDQYKEGDLTGEYYFYAAGIVVAPETHNDIRIAGLRTSIMEPVCDTPNRSRKTVDDHIAWILNELRKLGVDTSGLTIENLEATAAAVKEEATYFRFRTWKGQPTKEFPNPRVNEQWKGATEYNGEAPPAVEDNSPEVEEAVEAPADEEPATGDEVDLVALGAAADDGDEEAAAKLEELAEAAGIDASSIEKWSEVAATLAGDGGAGSTEEAATPAEGEVWYFKKPGAKKFTEVEITKVFSNGKANVKDLDTQSVIRGVELDKLNPEPK